MMRMNERRRPFADRGPLRVMFVNTSMPVGGAETLLVNLVRNLDRDQFQPEISCLKELGPLGEKMSREIPTFSGLIGHKFDVRVLGRLVRLFRQRRIDAVVTVGAGDKMFWGRLAAYLARVPVILSALHATGWPDAINRPNRWLTPITDGFIGVARNHGDYLVEQERFPRGKVFVIHNGVDTTRFMPSPTRRAKVRAALGIPPDAMVGGIVAALRPEKNHERFVRVAARVREQFPGAHFVIVGDGPLRKSLESLAERLDLTGCVHFTGTRGDIEYLLPTMDLFCLTSHMEANPVSILEALACGVPVVAPRVGSISETVRPNETGLLTSGANDDEFVEAWWRLFHDRELAQRLGQNGREMVESLWSLKSMVAGYQDLIRDVYDRKCDLGTVQVSPQSLESPSSPFARRK